MTLDSSTRCTTADAYARDLASLLWSKRQAAVGLSRGNESTASLPTLSRGIAVGLRRILPGRLATL